MLTPDFNHVPPEGREAARRLWCAAFGEPSGYTFHDEHGKALAGGRVYVYEHGTTIPAVTYWEPGFPCFNTHPIVLDRHGAAPIFFDSGRWYDIKIVDARGVQVTSVIELRT